jgi:KaiC/GvpD/RAD55 family RecA-like ATPase
MNNNIELFNKLVETGIPMGKMVALIGKSETPTIDMRKYLCVRLVSQDKCQLSEIVKDIKKKTL